MKQTKRILSMILSILMIALVMTSYPMPLLASGQEKYRKLSWIISQVMP